MASIVFACKWFPIDQILKCSFDLSHTEMEILKLLVRLGKEADVNEILKYVEKDRTTIQRSMKSLVEKKLVNRRQINLKSGGYVFVYSAKSKEYIKEQIYKNFEKFREVISNEIERW